MLFMRAGIGQPQTRTRPGLLPTLIILKVLVFLIRILIECNVIFKKLKCKISLCPSKKLKHIGPSPAHIFRTPQTPANAWKLDLSRENQQEKISEKYGASGGNRNPTSLPILLLAMDSATDMGKLMRKRERPIKDNGKCLSFLEAFAVHFSLLSLLSFLASSVLLLPSFCLWPVPQHQVNTLCVCVCILL